MRNSTFGNAIALRALFVLTTLMATALGHAQNLTVTAANSSNDAIYNVVFSNGGGSITVLNTDGGSLHRLTSLVFFPTPLHFSSILRAADEPGRRDRPLSRGLRAWHADPGHRGVHRGGRGSG